MAERDARFHAHVYCDETQRPGAAVLRERFLALTAPNSAPQILFVGRTADGPVGPHPLPQFEVHFAAGSRKAVIGAIAPTGLRALVHPLTDDDLADHTTLAHWIGEPLALDLSALDAPGENRGMARFGTSDF